MIFRHIAFVYALKSSLRGDGGDEYKKYLSPEEVERIKRYSNRANSILDIQAEVLERIKGEGIIDNFHFLALTDLLRSMCDAMGRSERIKNTVFPTTYIYFTRVFIWMFVVLLTMSISGSVGTWSIFFGWVLGFVFHITHLNGMSIINPFTNDPASVPISSISRTIEINMLETLGHSVIPEPVIPINDEYLL